MAGSLPRARVALALTAALLASPALAPGAPPPARLALESSVVVNGTQAIVEATAPPGARLEAALGTGGPPLLFAPMLVDASGASAVFGGLEPLQAYRYTVLATVGSTRALSRGTFATGVRADAADVATDGTAIVLGGQPFFPILAWQQCPATLAAGLAIGVNLFMGDCGAGALPYAQALAGRADFLIDAGRASTPLAGDLLPTGTPPPGMVGYFQPDEADGYGIDPSLLPTLPTNDLVFETFTYHFAPSEAPPSAGQGIYSAYLGKANVYGFDVYPLAQRCPSAGLANARGLGVVFDDQRALENLVGTRPTYQWIEVNGQDGLCGADPVPPQAVVAESWLAVAGGASGLGYFTEAWPGGTLEPFDVSPANQAAVATTVRSLEQLAPALTTPPLYGSVQTGSPLKVGARELNGAVYVIAVNTSPSPVRARFSLAALVGHVARVGFTDASNPRIVTARVGGGMTDVFAGYGVHVYVFPPAAAASLPA